MPRQAATATATSLRARPDATITHEPYLVAVGPETLEPAFDLGAVSLNPCAPHSVWTSESLHRRMLAAADAVAISVAMVALLIQFGVGVAAVAAAATIPVVVFLFKVTGLYNHDELRLGHSTLDEVPLLAQLTGLLTLGVAILRPVLTSQGLGSADIAALWAASFAAILAGRVVARSVARRVVPVDRCLVVAEVDQAERIRDRIAVSRARADIVACLSPEDFGLLDAPEVIRDLVHELGVHRIIVGPAAAGQEGVVDLVRMAKAVGVRVSVLPPILSAIGAAGEFDEVEGMAMLGVPRFGLARSSQALKRAFDLAATSIGLFLIAPVILAIAAAIRIDSPGPIFFRQVRVGRGGRHFRMIKFRSMVTDAEARKDELRSLSIAGPGLFKINNDPRVTRVGKLLRATSLDELPQLFNVLRGEMSLVGPRPLVIDEDAQVRGLDRSRLRLKPGMTGPWQTLGSRVALPEMVGIDYLYASHWSLWLDLKIMVRTVRHVLRRGNV